MTVTDIQRFCMHDGPGLRTTVFLKGCPLRCAWCHNPETQSPRKELLFYETKCIGCQLCASCSENAHIFPDRHIFLRDLCILCEKCADDCPTNALEMVGDPYTPEELLEAVKKDFAFFGETGGITVSGGEPFMQWEEAISFLRLCKENNIHTAVETCGFTTADVIRQAAPWVDLFLWDIKDTDTERHKQYTGVPNERIIRNLLLADSLGAKTRVRCILVNGVNTDETHYENIARIVANLLHCEGVEFLPYHSYGGAKSLALGKENSGNDAWIPTAAQIQAAKTYLREKGVTVI